MSLPQNIVISLMGSSMLNPHQRLLGSDLICIYDLQKATGEEKKESGQSGSESQGV